MKNHHLVIIGLVLVGGYIIYTQYQKSKATPATASFTGNERAYMNMSGKGKGYHRS